MAGKAHLLGMPPEVKFLIMAELDAMSLSALTSSCRVFRTLYIRYRDFFNKIAGLKDIGHAIPLAFALYAANHAPWKAQWPVANNVRLIEDVHRFGQMYLNRGTSIPSARFSLPMIAKMLEFHRAVEELTEGFLSNAFFMHTNVPDASIAGDPSSTEIARVQRGCYAIEITRVLLPYQSDHEFDRPWSVLWHYFSPWEHRIAREIEEYILITIPYPEDQLQRCLPESERMLDTTGGLTSGWVVKYGIRGLSKIDDPDWLLGSYLQLADECLEHPFRATLICQELWWEDVFCLTWLKRDPVDTTPRSPRSPNIDHLIARYPEVENGARDLWYFMLYTDEVKHLCYWEFDIKYECIAWWDRARFQTLYPDILPTLQQMQDELKDKRIEVTNDEITFPEDDSEATDDDSEAADDDSEAADDDSETADDDSEAADDDSETADDDSEAADDDSETADDD